MLVPGANATGTSFGGDAVSAIMAKYDSNGDGAVEAASAVVEGQV